MSGRYLLDSNAVIALFNNVDAVRDLVEAADEVYLSATVIGELAFGAQNFVELRVALPHTSRLWWAASVVFRRFVGRIRRSAAVSRQQPVSESAEAAQ